MGNCETGNAVTLQEYKTCCNKWNVKEKDVKEAMKLARADKLSIGSPLTIKDRMILFVYVKNILDMNNEHIRRTQINKLFVSDRDAFTRLERIVEIGESSTNQLTAFDNFVKIHPEWSTPETSWVLFRDHPSLRTKHSYVERTQLSGLCYMHGPVVFQHYLVSMNCDDIVGMVDIADYLRKHMATEPLKNHIFADSGGHSTEFARTILGFETQESFEKPDVKCAEVPHFMKQYGPGLVSSMEIWSCFLDPHQWVHVGLPRGRKQGHHAMVLVGYRHEKGALRFLLQNWWQQKAFVEVDGNYLRACGALLTFCNTPQRTIPKTFETNLNRHVEAAHDSCEQFPLETNA
jgi:hypothetical protein